MQLDHYIPRMLHIRRGVTRGALTTIVALSLITACAGDEDVATDSSRSTAATTPSAAATPGAAAAPTAAPWTLTATGGHGVRIGMSEAEVRAALGLSPVVPVKHPGCRYLDDPGKPPALAFMLENDTLTRIEVRDGSVATAEGARVGSGEAEVKAMYPSVESQPHKYTGPTGHYLIVTPANDNANRMVFETDGNRITVWRVGRTAAVQYVEGCS